MKKRDVLVATLLFLALVTGTANIVITQLTGNSLFVQKQNTASLTDNADTCTDKSTPHRPATNDPQLKALPEYEQVCHSAVASDMMIFNNMPISGPNATQMADAMAVRLKTFAAENVKPIMITEPDSDWGLIDFHEYTTGMYDGWNATYFNRLKADGITDSELGLWIPFPEPQQPYWNNNGDPDDFAADVNRYFRVERSVFPHAQTGILLDSQVGSDQASQLPAYTRLIDNSLVDVAGLQGFPWHPSDPTDSRKTITSAAEFAPAAMAEQIAKSLGTNKILLNVGSYRHMLTQNGGELAISTDERQATLESIVDQAAILRKDNYAVTVNVFAQNKLAASEGIDWSYWAAGNTTPSANSKMFVRFVNELYKQNVTISLYDARN